MLFAETEQRMQKRQEEATRMNDGACLWRSGALERLLEEEVPSVELGFYLSLQLEPPSVSNYDKEC